MCDSVSAEVSEWMCDDACRAGAAEDVECGVSEGDPADIYSNACSTPEGLSCRCTVVSGPDLFACDPL